MSNSLNLNNYNSFQLAFNKSTRSINLILREKTQKSFDMNFLYELESFFIWAFNKVEINTIVIKTSNPELDGSMNLESFKDYTINDLKQFSAKLQILIFFMFQMPQTIIFNLSKKTNLFLSELSIGADIRIAHEDIEIQFDHLNFGLAPNSGAITFLQTLIGHSIAKSWILSGKKLQKDDLMASGYVLETYKEEQDVIKKIMNRINKQSHFERIQSKLCFFEMQRQNFENSIQTDSKITRSAFITHNFKSKQKFKTPMEMAEILETTLKEEDKKEIFNSSNKQYHN